MVEQSDVFAIFDEVDRRRRHYRTQLSEHFGHLEPDAVAEVMKTMRDAYKNGNDVTLRQLHEQLTDKMLMVGGINDIAIEQLSAAMNAYKFDQPAWNLVVAKYEKEQGENNVKN